MNILKALQQEGLEQCSAVEQDKLRVDNIIVGKSLYTMAHCDNVFTDMNMCLVLLEDAYGFAYFHDEISYKLERFVNRQIPEILESKIPDYFRVALVDALYSVVNARRKGSSHYFTGNLREKAAQRAKLLLQGIPEGANIVLLGAVTEIIKEALSKLLNANVIDLQPQKIGLQIDANTIEQGSAASTDELFNKADYAIASGMMFSTQTAEEVFDAAKKHNTQLILFMETGANFGQQLIRYGAYKVLSEHFPFYDFYGDTQYDLYEKEKE